VIGRNPYRKRKSYTLTVFIILLAIFLSFSSIRNLFGVRSFLLAVIYPFQLVSVSVWKGIIGTPGAILNLRHLSNQNAAFKDEVKKLKATIMLQEEAVKENRRLKANLNFKRAQAYRYKLLPARVIGKSPIPWFTILLINRGSKNGVVVDKPVMVKEGLVGRVIEVSAFSSKVMLITDVESSVAAADERSRDFGIVKGGARNRLYMKYVSAGKDIRTGDKVVTSYISTIFPQGVPVGTISQASKREHDLFYNIEIEPAVDFSKIEEVFVIL
jgi:rod shape-determining protein MreC